MRKFLFALAITLGLLTATPAEAQIAAIAGRTDVLGENNDGTTTAIDTTGATLIVVAINWYSGITGVATFTDSKSNTWTPLTQQSGEDVATTRLYYAVNPIVGSGHTWTGGGENGAYSVIHILAFSGTHASDPFDQESGAVTTGMGTVASFQPGSITPSEANQLFVTSMSATGTGSAVPAGYTGAAADFSGGVNIGSGIAYKIQSGMAAAENPAWTWSNADSVAGVAMAAFLEDAGAPPPNTGILEDLVAYWELNEGSGDAVDAHGSSDLTDRNTVASTTGKVGNARDFEASNTEYFDHADSATLSSGDIDFTVCGWVFAESLGGFPVAINKGWGGGAIGDNEFVIYYSGTRWTFGVANAATSEGIPADNAGAASTSQWYFICAWHDSANDKIAISVNSGTANEEAYSAGVNDGTLSFELGASSRQSLYWDGLLDEWGYWKRLLTPSEITWLYNGGSGRSYTDLVNEAGEGGGGGDGLRNRMLTGFGL